MRSSVLVLVLCCGLVQARDPFQPPGETACDAQVTALVGWRLQGIIGTPQRYVAWLLSPQGKIYRLAPQARLPRSSWQVSELTAQSLTLSAGSHCATLPVIWTVKGGFYEKNDAVAALVPERAAVRQ